MPWFPIWERRFQAPSSIHNANHAFFKNKLLNMTHHATLSHNFVTSTIQCDLPFLWIKNSNHYIKLDAASKTLQSSHSKNPIEFNNSIYSKRPFSSTKILLNPWHVCTYPSWIFVYSKIHCQDKPLNVFSKNLRQFLRIVMWWFIWGHCLQAFVAFEIGLMHCYHLWTFLMPFTFACWAMGH
jgi:hypothetical protein